MENISKEFERIGAFTGSATPLHKNEESTNNTGTIKIIDKVRNYIEINKNYTIVIIFFFFLGYCIHQVFQKKQNLNQIKIDLELYIPIHVTFPEEPEGKSHIKKSALEKQDLTEGHFVITGLSIYLEEAPKDLGEQRGAKTDAIMVIKKTKEGSKVNAPLK